MRVQLLSFEMPVFAGEETGRNSFVVIKEGFAREFSRARLPQRFAGRGKYFLPVARVDIQECYRRVGGRTSERIRLIIRDRDRFVNYSADE